MQTDVYQTLSELGISSLTQEIVAEIAAPHVGTTVFGGNVAEFINLVDGMDSSCYTIIAVGKISGELYE
jgi:hypothetical protein